MRPRVIRSINQRWAICIFCLAVSFIILMSAVVYSGLPWIKTVTIGNLQEQLDVIQKPCLSNPCSNDATCRADGDSYKCLCSPGYTGIHCETTPCSLDPCGSNELCNFTGTQFHCSCRPGITGDSCQFTPCSENQCQNGATCQFYESGFKSCQCRTGFSGSNCESVTCSPNPCQNNGTCQLFDNGVKTGHACDCPNGISGQYCDQTACTRMESTYLNTYYTGITDSW